MGLVEARYPTLVLALLSPDWYAVGVKSLPSQMEVCPMFNPTRTTYQVHAADGTVLNYGWPTMERAEADAARVGAGAVAVAVTYEVEPCGYERVLIEAGVPDADWPLLVADIQRMLNMTLDAGRPSDAMRCSVRAYQAGTLSREAVA